MNNFLGKKAVVVGGSGGIGAYVSRMLVCEGAEVVVHGGHDSDSFSSLMMELEASASRTESGAAPVSIVQELSAKNLPLVDSTPLMDSIRRCDILCVCFGPFLQKPIDKTLVSDWIDVALLDYALAGCCVSTALPGMVRGGWGRIVLFGGTRTYGVNGFLTNAAYAGAKTGVSSLVKSVAAGYAHQGITCNAVLPGFTDTEYQSERQKELLANRLPGGKMISPVTIADAVRMLLSTPAMNGVLLPVDFGWQP